MCRTCLSAFGKAVEKQNFLGKHFKKLLSSTSCEKLKINFCINYCMLLIQELHIITKSNQEKLGLIPLKYNLKVSVLVPLLPLYKRNICFLFKNIKLIM